MNPVELQFVAIIRRELTAASQYGARRARPATTEPLLSSRRGDVRDAEKVTLTAFTLVVGAGRYTVLVPPGATIGLELDKVGKSPKRRCIWPSEGWPVVRPVAVNRKADVDLPNALGLSNENTNCIDRFRSGREPLVKRKIPMAQVVTGQTLAAHEHMTEMIFSYFISQAVRAFADLSIADHLADGPLSAAEVAQREGSAADTTFRLMRAGIHLGLLTYDNQHRFAATALLDTLRKDDPQSLRGLALTMTSWAGWRVWGEFSTAVRQGHTQAEAVLGMSYFEFLQNNPVLSVQFSEAMTSTTALWTSGVVDFIDTSDVTLAVDVGGATGSLLRLLQDVNPELRGIVYDRPHVAEALTADLAGTELAERLLAVGGDFFTAVPEADLYLLKFILHDWDDEQCVTLLRRCQESLLPGGRLVIVEMVIAADGAPGMAAMMDLNMLAALPGRERTLDEYDALLAAAGLRRSRFQPTASPLSVIEVVAE